MWLLACRQKTWIFKNWYEIWKTLSPVMIGDALFLNRSCHRYIVLNTALNCKQDELGTSWDCVPTSDVWRMTDYDNARGPHSSKLINTCLYDLVVDGPLARGLHNTAVVGLWSASRTINDIPKCASWLFHFKLIACVYTSWTSISSVPHIDYLII